MNRSKHAHSIIPAPACVEPGAGRPIELRSGDPLCYSDPLLAPLAKRWADDLASSAGMRLRPMQESLRTRGVEIRLTQDARAGASLADTHGLSPSGDDPHDERYRLSVGEGAVRIEATAPEGVFRALSSVAQMIGAAAAGAGSAIAGEPVDLEPVEVLDDMPGHCAAAFAAYPGRLSSADAPIAGQAPMTLDPDDAQTMEFVRTVVASMAEVTPGPYIHIGGDEAFGMDDEAYARFVRQSDTMARDAGKTPVAWQEASRGGIGSGGISQYWMTGDPDVGMLDNAAEHGFDIPPEMLKEIRAGLAQARGDLPRALDAGARILVTPTTHVYLDQPHAESGPDEQEQRRTTVGLQMYQGTTLEEVQGWDPLTLAPELTDEAQIAGVEAALWCETVETFADAQFLLQPRLACVAERAWSPRSNSDWADLSRRLADRAPAWRRLGWDFFRANSVDWS